MAKNLKLKIKNTQLSAALKLGEKLDKKKPAASKTSAKPNEQEKTAPPSAVRKKPVVKIKQKEVPKEPEVAEEVDQPIIDEPAIEEQAPPEPVVEERRQLQVIEKEPSPLPKKTTPIKQADDDKPSFKAPQDKKKPAPPTAKRFETMSSFDARDRAGLRLGEERKYGPRRRKGPKQKTHSQPVLRPTELNVKLPISVKDLAAQMKIKAAEIVSKLFKQGMAVMINDELDDETTVQIIGEEFGCAITIDTSEEERLRITGKTIQEEIQTTDPDTLKARPPVVAFMGHVDHGKTSLIDSIRKSNITAKEAGAITQHIGAFRAFTKHGEVTILDTPGHEAFTEMRQRGADVTDLVILVVAGDEGMKPQTDEALSQAQEAGVPVVVAINKCDKPDFNADNVYRQLSDRNLLPEAWGGQTLTVNCSATTGEGIDQLLEMVLLQAEMLELNAEPTARARGSILESELSRGFGPVATVLVQNGMLKKGDALVIDHFYGRVKTMHDEHQKSIDQAGPSVPVKITGLSGVPEAGAEFIVVENEKEARKLSEERVAGFERKALQKRTTAGFEELMKRKQQLQEKKVFPIVLRTDVQGSLEAVKNSLKKIPQSKIELNIISEGIGQISESDVELAAASNAVIIGFHTQVESHAEPQIKNNKLEVKLYDIIYHLVDGVKEMMVNQLDKVSEEKEVGEAEVRATFKSSQHGIIAGCQVTDGIIKRNHNIKQIRDDSIIWEGSIASLKRVNEDVKEVSKGFECGILLKGQTDIAAGDILKSFETTYHTQTLE
ncbi:MAG: translation initiation factor IF-2 [Chlamydiales bacterium]|nr:translation initiation factor IF-2 [Chlamydiales bacterium]